jgi:tRNA pseudouridine synthase 10
MDILKKAQKILSQPICDHCLGRQFAQLLHGYGNVERGKIIRAAVAMSIDKDEEPLLDMSNFTGFKFHNLEAKVPKKKKCSLCNNFFESLDSWVDRIARAKKAQFKTFLVGTRLSSDLVRKEEDLWEKAGIDYCEPIKAEINRETGKLVEKRLGLRCDLKRPDVNFILDIPSKKVITDINPIFIYGEYQKLIRGIPQTRWPSGKYKTSVEQIIAKPFMKTTRGSGHKFHGLGREDIDARCLAWRPFVLEILEPKIRQVDMKKAAKKIKKTIKVRKLRHSDIIEVRKIKETRVDKTYTCKVVCKKSLEKKDLRKLSDLACEIRQKTPRRVLHRRADKLRKRKVRKIITRMISKRIFRLTVKGEAGLYIKELVDGDEGRTRPNISSLLGISCACKDLDVVKIHIKN